MNEIEQGTKTPKDALKLKRNKITRQCTKIEQGKKTLKDALRLKKGTETHGNALKSNKEHKHYAMHLGQTRNKNT